MGAVAIDDGFVIALPYGPNTDWLKNVLASGSATIVTREHLRRGPAGGRSHGRGRPLLLPQDRRAHGVFGVDQCLGFDGSGQRSPSRADSFRSYGTMTARSNVPAASAP